MVVHFRVRNRSLAMRACQGQELNFRDVTSGKAKNSKLFSARRFLQKCFSIHLSHSMSVSTRKVNYG
jgi:hypothetical protein